MRLSFVSSLLSLLLVSSSVAASEKKTLDQGILDSAFLEDEFFWGRDLEGTSMSVATGVCEIEVRPVFVSLSLSSLLKFIHLMNQCGCVCHV